MEPRKYPPHETRDRIKKWCDLQERAHVDVRNKLKTWGVFPSEADQILAVLIESNYLNEERFARAFARGKFRMKGWGWKKIENHLRQKRISPYCMLAAKSEIEVTDYHETLTTLLRKKMTSVKDRNPWSKRQKIMRFAFGRGYEMDAVRKALDEISSE